MTIEQYQDYCNAYIRDIEYACVNLEDENYKIVIEAVQGLVELVGEHWRQRYHDDMI